MLTTKAQRMIALKEREAPVKIVHSSEDSQVSKDGLSPRQISESISQIERTRHLNPPVGATGRAERTAGISISGIVLNQQTKTKLVSLVNS